MDSKKFREAIKEIRPLSLWCVIMLWHEFLSTQAYAHDPIFPERYDNVCLVRRSLEKGQTIYDEIYLVWLGYENINDYQRRVNYKLHTRKLKDGQCSKDTIFIDDISAKWVPADNNYRVSIKLRGHNTNTNTSWNEFLSTTIFMR